APVGICRTTREGRFLMVNQRLVEMLGYDSLEQLLRVDLGTGVYMRAADRTAILARYEGERAPSQVEVQWKRRDGTPLWVQISTRTIRDEAGTPLHFESFVQDVTERKGVEERFLKAFHGSPVAMSITRLQDGRFVDANEALLQLYGITREEAIGQSVVELRLATPEDREAVMSQVRTRGSVRNVDVVITTRSGERKHLLGSAEVFELAGEPCVLGLALDVTDRMRAQQELQRSEERLQLVGRATSDVVWDWDPGRDVLWWGAAVQALFGYRAEELGASAEGWRSRVHPDDAEHIWASLQRAMANPVSSWAEEYRFRRADGEYVWVLDRCYILRDVEGRPVRLVGSMLDITEQRRAAEELRRSHEQLRKLAQELELVREQERRNLSRELHDELGQLLTALKIDLGSIERRLRTRSRPPIGKVRAMAELVEAAVEVTHRIATALRPGILDDLGLVPAIRWQAKNFEQRTGIACTVDARPDEVHLEDALATALFRIVQESLTNVARHAQAKNVHLTFVVDERELRLVIRDDGRGITRSEATRTERLGLVGLRERVGRWHGQFDIVGHPDEGTTVSLRIPLRREGGRAAQAS
ncbi:MAG: PAS domain S-box protein, partial [Gemmatimonadetes bacterium]|nr:PAS domain S-box protein [Gemmatimonadota bacterium]